MIGKVVGRLLVAVGIKSDELQRDGKRAQDTVRGLGKEFASAAGGGNLLASVMSGAMVAGAGAMVRQVASATYGLAEFGAGTKRARAALEDLVPAGQVVADGLVKAVRDAAGGTVSEMTAMAALNRGILLGLGDDVSDWADLMEVARFRARAMGITTSQALGDITTGIGRESRMILDNLGIILDTDAALANYAATHNKAVDALTAFERKEAIKQAVIADGKAQIEAAGGMVDDYADSFEQLRATMEDAKMVIAEELTPVVAALNVMLQDMVETLGPVLRAEAKKTADDLGQLQQIIVLFGTESRAGFMAESAIDTKGTSASLDELVESARQAKAQLLETFVGLDSILGHDISEFARVSGDELLELGIRSRKSFGEIEAAAARLGVNLPEDAMLRYTNAVRASADESQRWRNIQTGVIGAMRDVSYFGEAATRKVHALAVAYSHLSQETRDWMAERTVADLAGMDPYDTVAGQERALQIIEEQREANEEREEERAKDYTKAWKSAYDDQVRAAEQAYQDIRSAVQSALQPTDVSALDMSQAGEGTYTDKWDENRRRALAIAARGFEELDVHPDWAGILKIPPEVLRAGEDVLKEWANNLADSIGSLERPDLINMDAAVDAVQAYLDRQAAVELTIDLVTKEAIERGLVTGDDAKARVAEALGVETSIGLRPTLPEGAVDDWKAEIGTVSVPVSLAAAAAEGDTASAGGAKAMMQTFSEGFQEYLETATWGADIANRIKAGLEASSQILAGAARDAGKTFWDNFLSMVQGSGLVDHIIAEVLETLTESMEAAY